MTMVRQLARLDERGLVPDGLGLLREQIERFVKTEVIPAEGALSPDVREFPPEVVTELRAKAKAAGYWMLQVPEELGGGGLSAFEAAVVGEEMAKHKFAFSSAVFGREPPVALYNGTPDQIERFVKPAIEEGWETFTAISEATGGSDPARAIRTVARREGDEYVINGQKMWTTHIENSRYGIVYARTDPNAGRNGISAFVVPTDTPGIEITQVPVLRNHWSNEVSLNDVRVPAENLVGEEGQGFALAGQWTERGRLFIAAFVLGVAEASVQLAIEYARDRETFGAPLATRQSVQFAIAESDVELAATRWLVWDAAMMYDADPGTARAAVSGVKFQATETSFKVIDRMMQIFGGMGVAKEMPLEHWFRDVRVCRIVAGPSEVHKYVVARDLLGAVATARPQWPPEGS
jgi:acyl-CoA dehydrogenase